MTQEAIFHLGFRRIHSHATGSSVQEIEAGEVMPHDLANTDGDFGEQVLQIKLRAGECGADFQQHLQTVSLALQFRPETG